MILALIAAVAAYLLTGYTIGKVTNRIYRDNRPNSDFWWLGRLARIFWFPISYHDWNSRQNNNRASGYDELGPMRAVNGNGLLSPGYGRDTGFKEDQARLDERYCQWLMFIWPIKILPSLVLGPPQILWFSILFFPRTLYRAFALLGRPFSFDLKPVGNGLRNAWQGVVNTTSDVCQGLASILRKTLIETDKPFAQPSDPLEVDIKGLKEFRDKELGAHKDKLVQARQVCNTRLKLTQEKIAQARTLLSRKVAESSAARRCSAFITVMEKNEKEQTQQLQNVEEVIDQVAKQEQEIETSFELLELFKGTGSISSDMEEQVQAAIQAATDAKVALLELLLRTDDAETLAMINLDIPLEDIDGPPKVSIETRQPVPHQRINH